jgi:hypothetical protein
MTPSAHPEKCPTTGKDLAVLDGRGKRLQTRTRRTFWDKIYLAKDIERPFRDWDKVEW